MKTIAEHLEVLTRNTHLSLTARLRRPAFAAIGAVLLSCSLFQARAEDPVKVTELMTKNLENVPGKEATMITVDYAPGAADPIHRHNASAFVYVLQGTIEMQMKGGKKVTLHPGDTFYEDPAGIHLVGKNASKTEPAKFLVVLIKDKGSPILIPTHEQHQGRPRPGGERPRGKFPCGF